MTPRERELLRRCIVLMAGIIFFSLMAAVRAHSMDCGDNTSDVAVNRGQLVCVDTSGKGWRIRTAAKAHGTGTVGDIITVEDMKTRKKYPVRITGPGTVSVVVDKNKIIRFIRNRE